MPTTSLLEYLPLLISILAASALSFDYDIQCTPFPARETIAISTVAPACFKAIGEMTSEPQLTDRFAWQTSDMPRPQDQDTQILPVTFGLPPCTIFIDTPGAVTTGVQDFFALVDVVPLAVNIVDRCLVQSARGGRTGNMGGSAMVGEFKKVRFDVVVGGQGIVRAVFNGTNVF